MSTPRTNPVSSPVLEEKIRLRAFELFQQRGGGHGRDLDDWFQAESELLRAKLEAAAPAAAKRARSRTKPATDN